MSNCAYINGKAYRISEKETILSFVRRHLGQEEIPVLCHADHLIPCGSCRLCIVELAQSEGGARRIAASCHSPLASGQYIFTRSPRIERLRKNLMELVLSDYPKEKLTSRAGEKNTQFQQLMQNVALANGRYPEFVSTHQGQYAEDASHPYIKANFNECIYCYRCIRACDEVQGQFVLSASGRGFATQIISGARESFKESDCVSCGACVQSCPTEALTDRYHTKTILADHVVRTTCTYCGVGCSLNVHIKDNHVAGIDAPWDAPVNHGHTCLKGRYAFEFYKSPERLQSPLIREGDSFRPVSWQEAFTHIADKLKSIKHQFGSDSIGGISSSRCTNEENYLMQKFLRVVIGSNNIDGCARVCHAPTAFGMQKAFGTGAATNGFDDIEKAQCFLIVGANPTDAHPIIGAKIKQRVLQNIPLVVVDPRSTELAKLADIHLKIMPGSNIAVLNLLAYYLIKDGYLDQKFIAERTENYAEFEQAILRQNTDQLANICGVSKEKVRQAARVYGSTAAAMCFHGLGVTEHFQGSRTVMLLSAIAMMTGNIGRPGVGINPLRGQNNVQGAADMGVQPHQGPGYVDMADPDIQKQLSAFYHQSMPTTPGLKIPEMLGAAAIGQLKALWIMGEDIMQTDPDTTQVKHALETLDFLVVQELFMTETARKAHVVLPAACFLEKDGTFTNSERRVQLVNRAVEPLPGVKADGQIIAEIMQYMGYSQADYDADALMEEIQAVSPSYRGIHRKNLGTQGLQWPLNSEKKGTSILHGETFKRGKGRFIHYDYLASPEFEHRKDYPFILTTGRDLEHYNCGSMTRRTPNVELMNEDLLAINPKDAARLGIMNNERVRLKSPRGETSIRAHLTDDMDPGVLYTTFHFPQIAINHITGCVGDLDTLTPEFKVVSVNVEKM